MSENKVLIKDEDIVQGIMEDIAQIQFETVEEEKKAFKQIGNVIKAEVIKLLKVSDKKHVHMADDVKVHISNKSGLISCVVGGGKETGYKWHMLDSGTRNPNGTVHTPATNFVSKALKNSESEIEKILTQAEKERT